MSLLLLLGAGGGGEPAPPPDPDEVPEVVVEIAFGHTWQDASPTWTDVTDYVYFDIQMSRGRSRELDTFQTGSASWRLMNEDRRFDPLHSAGPHFGHLKPRVPCRIRATYNSTTYDLFRGFIDGWPQAYFTANEVSVVDITASDAFKLLSGKNLAAGFFTLDSATLGVLDEDRLGGTDISTTAMSGGRIGALLDVASWPDGLRDISEGSTECQGQDVSGTTLEALQLVERSEDGFLYIGADGSVTFLGRHDRQSLSRMSTSQATFSDDSDDYPYADIAYVYDDQLIFNDVRRTREGGAERSAESQASIGEYDRNTNSLTGLVMSSDDVAQDLADVFLERFKDPIQRITDLQIDPLNAPTTLWPEVLGRQILDRVTVERTPQGIGSAISQDLLIQGLSHEWSNFRWRTTYYVTPVDSFSFFTLDSVTLGELDVDLLGA